MSELYIQQLKDVHLEEFIWPCLTYVMRRTGFKGTIKQFLELPRYDIPEDIPIGAVLWWNNTEKEKNWQVTIENNVVLETYTYNRGHFIVYEGNGLVSDLGFKENEIPYIRFRKLKELTPPDKMITGQ